MPAAIPAIWAGLQTAGGLTAAGAVATTALGVKGAVDQEKARQEADTQAGKAAGARQAMSDEERRKQAQDEANQANIAMRNAARGMSKGPSTRGGTILTSPLGVPQAGAAPAKTLLGA